MLRDRISAYYLDQDYNCAETVLHAINDEYGLEIPHEMFKLVGGFGGGMGCGNACGALCACISALGKLAIEGRAHATPDFKEKCSELVQRFQEKLGDTACSELVLKYKTEETRCLETVLLTADLFEEYIKDAEHATCSGSADVTHPD